MEGDQGIGQDKPKTGIAALPWPRGFFARIRFAFFLSRLIRQKRRDLWGCELDKTFFKSMFSPQLLYSDVGDRGDLAKEKRKPQEQQDVQKIMELEDRISEAKAIQTAYSRTVKAANEIEAYIAMLSGIPMVSEQQKQKSDEQIEYRLQ